MTDASFKPLATSRSAPGLLRTAAAAAIGAVVLGATVFFIASATTDNLLVTPPGGDEAQDVAFADIIVFTLLGGLVGAALAGGVTRFAARPQLTFSVICIVGLLAYGIMPFVAAEEAAAAFWLNAMHVAAAVPIVGGLARWLPTGRA